MHVGSVRGYTIEYLIAAATSDNTREGDRYEPEGRIRVSFEEENHRQTSS